MGQNRAFCAVAHGLSLRLTVATYSAIRGTRASPTPSRSVISHGGRQDMLSRLIPYGSLNG
jgi:hypothetical protein